MKRLFLALAIMVTVGALIVSANAQSSPQRLVVQVKHEGQARGGLRVKFVELIEDSRCPVDVNCISAGNAKIRIQVRAARGGAARTFEINTGVEPQSITHAGYTIKFTDLTPHPRSNIRINPSGYRATFEIIKAGKK